MKNQPAKKIDSLGQTSEPIRAVFGAENQMTQGIIGFLNAPELGSFGNACSGFRTEVGKARLAIIRDIGPTPDALLDNPNESYRQAYDRHMAIIAKLKKIAFSTMGGLASVMDQYPHYYLKNFIMASRFPQVINDYNSLVAFCSDYSRHEERIINRILENPADFVRVIADRDIVIRFCQQYPSFAQRALNRVFSDDTCFAKIICNTSDLYEFCKHFCDQKLSNIAERAIDQVLNNKSDFERLLCDETRLTIFYRMIKFFNFSPSFKKNAYLVSIGEKILNNDIVFSSVIKDEAGLEKFCMTYPEHAETAREKFRSQQKILNDCIKDLKKYFYHLTGREYESAVLNPANSTWKKEIIISKLLSTLCFSKMSIVDKLTYLKNELEKLDTIVCLAETHRHIIWDMFAMPFVKISQALHSCVRANSPIVSRSSFFSLPLTHGAELRENILHALAPIQAR